MIVWKDINFVKGSKFEKKGKNLLVRNSDRTTLQENLEKYFKSKKISFERRKKPTELRIDEFKVNGCQSQVWLVPEEKDNKLYFKSDSDALIAKGLVTLIASICSDEAPKDILNSEIDLMEEFELGVILSPARRNGAFSMLKTIKEFSQKLADWTFPPIFVRKKYPHWFSVFS